MEKAEQMLNSWLGHAMSACSYNFVQKLLREHDFLTMNKKGVFKIRIGGLPGVD